MALHQIDDSLLADWIAWSAISSSFEDGCCEEKWETFERLPGGHSPEGARGLPSLRAKAKEDGYVTIGGYEVPTMDTIQRRVDRQLTEENEMSTENFLLQLDFCEDNNTNYDNDEI
jgi:hypothetical protein